MIEGAEWWRLIDGRWAIGCGITLRWKDDARSDSVMMPRKSWISSAYVRLQATPSRAYAMGMPAKNTEWTVEMLNALPDDGNRYEVIDGELLVSPAPSLVHQRAALFLCYLLREYAESLEMEALVAPAGIKFSERREVQPDVFVLPKLNGRRAKRFEDVGELILAVEVLSPFSRRADRVLKRALFDDEGVPEYWIVDTNERVVERYRPGSPDPEVLDTKLAWEPSPDHDPLVIDLPQYFRSVHDD